MPRPRSLPCFFDSKRRAWGSRPSRLKLQATFIHHMDEVAAVVGDAGLQLVRHGGFGDEIAPPDLDRIDADDARGAVEQLLDQKGRLGPAGAAIGRKRNGVGQHRPADRVHRRNLIDAGGEAEREQRHHHGGAEDMRAHGVQRVDAKSQSLAALVEGEFAGDDLVAALGVAEQRFRACRHPFDRTAADMARRPHHERVFRIAAVLHAEAAADVGRDDAQFGFGNFQNLARDRRPRAVRILRR